MQQQPDAADSSCPTQPTPPEQQVHLATATPPARAALDQELCEAAGQCCADSDLAEGGTPAVEECTGAAMLALVPSSVASTLIMRLTRAASYLAGPDFVYLISAGLAMSCLGVPD